jgi:hypothetical protein
MPHNKNIEVEDSAAFFKLVKDLDPVAKIVLFEKKGKGRFKFLTKQHGELLTVSFDVQDSPYPVITPEGEVDHEIPVNGGMRADRDKFIYYQDLFRALSIETRLESRVKSLAKGLGTVLGTSRTTQMDWKKASKNEHILKLRVATTLNRKNRVVINVKYTDQHTKALTGMLEKAGFRVIPGRIT